MRRAVVFVQNRPHRAGAQTCLGRILACSDELELAPWLVCGGDGWLTREAEALGVPVVVVPFPASRSLGSRFVGNRMWARRVSVRLSEAGADVGLIHANDHWEGLLGMALADRLDVPAAIFLRSPGMTERDYWKYRCDRYDARIAVGDELCRRVSGWDAARTVDLLHDGITEAEILPPIDPGVRFPGRVLVLGSPLDWKGWADLTAALAVLEGEGRLDGVAFHFTGDRPNPARNDLRLERLSKVRCEFLGRREGFRELVRGYSLAVNPSRQESFGMAAVETLAAGVPLLSSRTGIIEQVIRDAAFLFPPGDADALASALRALMDGWRGLGFDMAGCQARIRERFLIGRVVEGLNAVHRRLVGVRP